MKCYKCHEEMTPIADTAWRKHKDGEKTRSAEFMCAECRIYVTFTVSDYSEFIDDDYRRERE